ncbi:MAG: prephenate dehydrogenase/arogenate dehydrogenase family protein [Clostridia bacterium]|nr:prephenate dehydrogenase/arogenate dehydrogenase family protein [Clostridia bacterium]
MKMMFVGLGLIGGSMALALNGCPGLERYAIERDEWTRFEALGRGAVKAAWADAQDAPIEEMDVVVLCLHPQACADFVTAHASRISEGAMLTDVCGVKRPLRDAVAALGDRRFVYLGGHPMAGLERGGFANATGDLFRGSHYILTPDETVPEECVRLMTNLATFIGCSDVVTATPEEHDERIGYTSQLMHVLALALCDQHLLYESKGFEGGSFRGATRVAAMDAQLWCELFWANKETLADLTDELAQKLSEYSALLRGGDREALLDRLTASSDRKKIFDRMTTKAPSGTPLYT